MAKGDSQRVRNQIDQQGGMAQNRLNGLWDTFQNQNNNFYSNFGTSMQDADVEKKNVTNQFQNFADTGGFSNVDLGNIRARAVSPLRSVYSNANREVDRSRALQGGYSPGFNVLKARMAREQSSGLSDATTNAEGMIAQLVNQGKQFGASGLLSAYGATPGNASLYANMLQNSNQNLLGAGGLQNQLGLGLIQGQIGQGNLPSNFDRFAQGAKGIESILGSAGKIGKMGQ